MVDVVRHNIRALQEQQAPELQCTRAVDGPHSNDIVTTLLSKWFCGACHATCQSSPTALGPGTAECQSHTTEHAKGLEAVMLSFLDTVCLQEWSCEQS